MEELLNVFSIRNVQSAVQGFIVDLNNNLTDKVRENLALLSEQEFL